MGQSRTRGGGRSAKRRPNESRFFHLQQMQPIGKSVHNAEREDFI